MKAFQPIPYNLPSLTWSAGGRWTQSLRDLPRQIQGRNVHLVGISWDVDVDPTFTAAPVPVGLNSVVSDLKIHDGSQLRFDGNFNYLRMFEVLENGNFLQPEPVPATSTNNSYFRRYWSAGPLGFAGNPSDFAMPAGALENATISYSFGALTDISSDTTAATVSIVTTAWLILLDEVRVPPAFERVAYAMPANDYTITGRALYPFMALLNSSSIDAIAGGDFSAITVQGSLGEIMTSIDAEALTGAYHAHMRSGEITSVQGEPRSSTDVNGRKVNTASPTALAAAAALIQPVLWSPQGCRISKIVAETDNNLRVRFSGSNTSSILLASRIIEQPPTVAAVIAAKALNRLGLGFRGMSTKTLTKDEYRGPRANYLPYKVTTK